jgi:arylsulfatase A-like enzyme
MSLRKRSYALLASVLIILTGLIWTFLYWRDRSNHSPCNVVLIVMDALRADHLSCNGYPTPPATPFTPNIDRLAQEGVNFKNAFCHFPLTLPSMSTLFTSLYPSVHGVRSNATQLPDVFVTLAEVFKRNHYETAAFVSGGYVRREFGLSQGFDTYVDTYDSITNLSKNALNWLRQIGGQKFFLYLHCLETHVPYNPPDKYKTPDNYNWDMIWAGSSQFYDKHKKEDLRDIYNQPGFLEKVIRLYDGEIQYADTELGVFFSELKTAKLYDNTLIIFTADHGEEFRDHWRLSHGSQLYDETTRVPLIMKLPGRYKIADRVVDALVGNIDIMPTITELTHMAFPDYPLQGQSLWPLLKGKKVEDRTVFLEKKGLFGLRSKDHKFLIAPEAKRSTEFYDLSQDPKEKSNLSKKPKKETEPLQREMAARLGRIIEENRQLALRFNIKERKTYSPEDIKKLEGLEEELKSLGYIR